MNGGAGVVMPDAVRKWMKYVRWRYRDNFGPWLRYRLRGARLSGEAKRILAELTDKGIAVTTAGELFQSGWFNRLRQEVTRLQLEMADEIDRARRSASETGTPGKTYALFLLNRPTLDLSNVFVQFALQDEIVDLANAYFGMYTKLRSYNVWHTFVSEGPPRESQLWHRDADDRHAFKCFVYLSDVDESAGPFTYAPGTHPRGAIKKSAAAIPGLGGRSSDAQIAEVLPRDRWIQATGRAGTVILADTQGYHKGGLARSSERIMYDCLYASQAARRPELFDRPDQLVLPVDPKIAFAVAPGDARFTQEFRRQERR